MALSNINKIITVLRQITGFMSVAHRFELHLLDAVVGTMMTGRNVKLRSFLDLLCLPYSAEL